MTTQNSNFWTDSDEVFDNTLENIKLDVLNLIPNLVKNDSSYRPSIYLAGPWFTERGKKWYDTIVYCIKELSDYCGVDLYVPRENTAPTPSETYEDNISEIQGCDAVVVLLDEKDCGTSFEVGYAKCCKKEIIFVGYDETTFTKSKTNVMLAMSGKAMTVANFINFLLNCKYETVQIPNSWEVLT